MLKQCKYKKLKGLIIEKYGTQKSFSLELGISSNSLTSKLNGTFPWKDREISKCCAILGIEQSKVSEYFFK